MIGGNADHVDSADGGAAETFAGDLKWKHFSEQAREGLRVMPTQKLKVALQTVGAVAICTERYRGIDDTVF